MIARDYVKVGAHAEYAGDREIGDLYLHAVDWLEKKLERMQ